MRKFALSFALFSVLSLAQSVVKVAPNCFKNFELTANGNSGQLDNRGVGCNVWSITFEKYGGTGAGSVTFQSARSNAQGLDTGLSWTTFTGTTLVGPNPMTATYGATWFYGGAPFVRVNVTGLNGTLRGTIWGWVGDPGATGSAGGGGITADVNIVSSIPLTVNQNQVCTSFARVNFSGTANLQIVPASGSLQPVICQLFISSDTATTIGISRGTGSNCGTGTTVVTTFPLVMSLTPDFQANWSTFALPASNAVCINSTVSATIGGLVFYRYQ